MTTVNPVQTTTYVLSIDNSTISFGTLTNIDVAKGDGILGPNEATSWVVNSQGSHIIGTSGVVLNFISSYVNSGYVDGTVNGGVVLNGGGLFTNNVGGTIYGGTGSTGWAVITGTTGGGYGSVPNTFANHGLIDGAGGGAQLAGATHANNDGTIEGGSVGLAMNGGGVLNNAGAIIGAGQTGAYFGAASKVTDSGTITGGVNAVQFAGSGANSLTLLSGATLNGALVGSTAAGATTSLTLKGAGTLNGSIQHFNSLIDQGAGTWVLNGVSTLGSATVQAGAGLQVGDATHSGASLTVTGSLQNGGVVQVDAGKIDVQGSVTGSGSLFILGGTLELGSTIHQTISFSGTTGVLQLDDATSFGGTVGGFDPTGTALDLRDIAFVSPNEATFSGTSAGGTLTVKDGTYTAHIALTGDFTSSTFVAQSDGHGGTIVYDPVATTNSQFSSLLHASLGITPFG
jgi:hypothetical protein